MHFNSSCTLIELSLWDTYVKARIHILLCSDFFLKFDYTLWVSKFNKKVIVKLTKNEGNRVTFSFLVDSTNSRQMFCKPAEIMWCTLDIQEVIKSGVMSCVLPSGFFTLLQRRAKESKITPPTGKLFLLQGFVRDIRLARLSVSI